jgi:hypothetical protein
MMKLLSLRTPAVVLAAAMALLPRPSFGLEGLVGREHDIGNLQLGQRIKVDDGSCPAGKIKEISGSKMSANGVVRVEKCVARLGPKLGR